MRHRKPTITVGVYAVLLLAAAMILSLAACSEQSQEQAAETETTEAETMTEEPKRPNGENRLALEKSPYLLQHKDNPVDWYPWGEEAFAAAQAQDKPIFLSIGYSTCHWCHVMEHESFEDSTVAAMMNETFVNVKVDREERPDIDAIYMRVCQMMTRRGGWPLTIIMTPDGKPFYSGTYFPKTSRFQQPGMLQLIPQIAEMWRDRRSEMMMYSDRVVQELQGHETPHDHEHLPLDDFTLEAGVQQLSGVYDATNGGFGSAPKFPTPHQLMFLLRAWQRYDDDKLLKMVEHSLDAMADGGIYDHLGFGFHRYSVDERWFAPHFEKMLYDQAMLTMAYTEAYLATGNERHRRVAEEIMTYVLRDMTDSRGGFYSAEDADSEGIEGKFYLWTEAELREVLGADADLFIDIYGVETAGNFEEDIAGANILYLKRPLAAVAKEKGVTEAELREQLAVMRDKLLPVRGQRIAPGKDDKILTDWNGLMIAAMAKAGVAFDNNEYVVAAQRAADFILTTLRRGDGSLMHRYREGDAGLQANIDDYAFMIWGLIELYEATFDVTHLETALALNDFTIERFWDEQEGGFYFTPNDGEQLIARIKEQFDGASPSGNSAMMLNLIRLARLTANPSYEDMASEVGVSVADMAQRSSAALTLLLCALDFGIGPSFEVVIVGKSDQEDAKAMRRALSSTFVPNKVVVFKDEDNPRIADLAFYTETQSSLDDKATAYVCRNYACELPTTDIDQMLQLLANPSD